MRIIEQYHEILDIPSNPLLLLEVCGRNCYQSQDKIGCTYNGDRTAILYNCAGHITETDGICKDTDCKYHSSRKFVKMLLDRGHHAMLEFGDITVRLVTNRGVLAELTRHRIASFAVSSTRYVRLNNNMEFIRPVWWEKDNEIVPHSPEWCFLGACEDMELCYKKMLSKGWKPEQAREVLPNSLKTEIIMKCNFREMIHILRLRTSKKAHPQIRALFLPILAELKQKIPVIFDDIKGE